MKSEESVAVCDGLVLFLQDSLSFVSFAPIADKRETPAVAEEFALLYRVNQCIDLCDVVVC